MTTTALKHIVCTIGGIAGGIFIQACGGWDTALRMLILAMVIDYITGFIVAAVFHNSQKTPSGRLDSGAGLRGLLRKGGILAVVIIAESIDAAMGTQYIRDAAVVGFLINESLSVLENVGLMGVEIPGPIKRAIDILHTKSEQEGESEDE